MALFLFLALASLLAAGWSGYRLIWKFNYNDKFFAWKHLLIQTAAGLTTFGMLFIAAMGSVGHYVASDMEIALENVFFAFSIPAFFISAIGGLVAMVKGILALYKQPSSPEK